MNAWMNIWMNEYMTKWAYEQLTYWTNEWMKEHMTTLTHGRMNESMVQCMNVEVCTLMNECIIGGIRKIIEDRKIERTKKH